MTCRWRSHPGRRPDPEEGPREHHPLEADVHDARALGEDAADGGEGERRREAQHRRDQPRAEDRVQGLLVATLEPHRPGRAGDRDSDRPPLGIVFHPWSEICDPSKGYIKNDTVIVEAYVKADPPVIG